MTRHDDREYYTRREEAERDLAIRSDDATIGRIHQNLADLYSERARKADVAQGPILLDHI